MISDFLSNSRCWMTFHYTHVQFGPLAIQHIGKPLVSIPHLHDVHLITFSSLKKSFVLHGAQVIKQQQVGPQIQPCQHGCLLKNSATFGVWVEKIWNKKWIKLQKLGTKTSINGVSFSQILLRQETHQKNCFFSLGISSNMYNQWLWSWRGQFSSNSRAPGVHPKDLIFWRGSGWMDSECFNYDARPCVFDTPRWWCHPQTTQTLTLRVWMKLRDTRGVYIYIS